MSSAERAVIAYRRPELAALLASALWLDEVADFAEPAGIADELPEPAVNAHEPAELAALVGSDPWVVELEELAGPAELHSWPSAFVSCPSWLQL